MTNLVCSLQFGGNIYKVIYWWVLEFCNQLKTWHVTCYLVQFSRSVLSDSVTPWTAACQASLSITNSQSSPKLMSIESVMPSNHLILCRPLLHLPSIFPSIMVFSNESTLHIRWPKQSFSFNISPSNEYSGLISFKIVLISLQCKGLSRVFSNTIVQSINSSVLSHLNSPTLTSIHDHWKNHSLDYTDLN